MKLLFIAALLVVWIPPLSSTPCRTVLRVKRDALDYACQTQRQPLQAAFKIIQIPLTVGTSILAPVLRFAGINILDVKLPEINVKLMPRVGMQVSIDTHFQMSGKILLVGNIGIEAGAGVLADLRITRTRSGFPVLSISACKSVMGQVKVTGGFGLISSVINLVSNHISAFLGDTLCISVSNVFLKINGNLGLMVGFNPIANDIGIGYTMPTSPVVTNDYMDMDLNVEYEVDQKAVEIPYGARDFTLPAEAGNKDSMVNMGFSPDFFTSLFLAFYSSGGFNLYIPSTSASLSRYLTISALAPYIPQISQRYQGFLPVDIKIAISKEPIVTLQSNQVLVQISPLVELSVATTTREHLVTFFVQAALLSSVNVNEGKLKLNARLGSLISAISSTSIGNFQAAAMGKYLSDIFQLAYMAQINGALSAGISLPSLPNVYTMNEVVVVTEEYAVMSCDVKYVEKCQGIACN